MKMQNDTLKLLEYFGENKLVMSVDHEQVREYRKHIGNSKIITLAET